MSHYWSCCANLLPTIRKGFRTKTRNKQPIKADITGGIASASFANHSYITHQSDWSHMTHRWSPYLCSCSSPSFSPCEPRWQKTTTAVAYRDVPRIWSQHVSYKIWIGKSTAGSILVDLCCYYHNIISKSIIIYHQYITSSMLLEIKLTVTVTENLPGSWTIWCKLRWTSARWLGRWWEDDLLQQ